MTREETSTIIGEDDNIEELDKEELLNDFQVVRREFFAHTFEIAVVVLSTDKCDLDRIKLNYKSKSIFKDPRLYSKLLVEKIFITSDWNLNKSYRVNVEFDHDKGGFTSDLTKAIELGAK